MISSARRRQDRRAGKRHPARRATRRNKQIEGGPECILVAEAAANGDDVALADAPTIAAAAKRLRVQPQAAEAMRLRAGLLANAKYDDLPANVGTDPPFSWPAPRQ